MDILEMLEDKYGYVSEICENLEISKRTYYNWRDGKSKITPKLAKRVASDLGIEYMDVVNSLEERRK